MIEFMEIPREFEDSQRQNEVLWKLHVFKVWQNFTNTVDVIFKFLTFQDCQHKI